MKIADAHTHIFPSKISEKASKSIGDFYEIGMAYPADIEILRENEKKIGTERCLVCSAAVTASQVTSINDFISSSCADAKKQGGLILVGFAAMHPDFEGITDELDRAKELGLIGVKFHNDFQKFDIDDERAVPMYREIAKRDMPILFHVGDNRYDYSSPKRVANLMRKIPDLKVIVSHFGGYRRWQDYELLPICDRIFFDTSSSLDFLPLDDANRILHHFGPDKFMFGTDFPMWDAEKELERFMRLDLSEKEREDVLYNNFRRLFG